MNLGPEKAKLLVAEMLEGFDAAASLTQEVILAVPFIDIAAVKPLIEGHSKFALAAQNLHQAESGAFTGEISAAMLVEAGCKYVLVGHSERREYFAESDALLKQKVDSALQNKMEVIFCFGEKLDDRRNRSHFMVVENQIKSALFHIKNEDWKSVILAYEPVWAVGTGKTATPEQAEEVHRFMRAQLGDLGSEVRILYGGSVKAHNADQLFALPDIDGALLGGASLDADEFLAICKAAD